MNIDSKIFVAGHNGLVGSNIVKVLRKQGYENLVVRSRKEVNLTDAEQVQDFFATEKPEYVFLAAAKVGGIMANSTYPVEFLRENLQIQTNIIDSAYRSGAKKLLFLGSSCIYPKMCEQPIKESYLLTGPLEPTNEWYAIAKIAGIKMCQAYTKQYGFNCISLMPTNLYGPGDNFDLESSHVLPALMRKFHDAKMQNQSKVTVWGTGNPRREFLYVEEMADASVYLMKNYNSPEIINVGTGKDVKISELASTVRDIVGFKGDIVYDSTKPDGTPRKLLDTGRINGLGWTAKVGLDEGIRQTYQWFTEKYAK